MQVYEWGFRHLENTSIAGEAAGTSLLYREGNLTGLGAEPLWRKEPIAPVDSLSEEDFKKLVIERQRAGPDYKVQAITGPPNTRGDVVRAIQRGEPFGRVTLEAEKSTPRDLLAEIQRDLKASAARWASEMRSPVTGVFASSLPITSQ